MVLTVHHLDNSRSQRILWLLVCPSLKYPHFLCNSSVFLTQEELQVPYEIKRYQRDAEFFAPKELKDVHGVGMSPILTEDDFTLAESGAIVGESRGLNFTSARLPYRS